jgi:hypothetical protein
LFIEDLFIHPPKRMQMGSYKCGRVQYKQSVQTRASTEHALWCSVRHFRISPSPRRPFVIIYLYTFIILLLLLRFHLTWTICIAMIASLVYWLEFLATDPEVRVRLPVLPDFLRSSGSGTGSTQSRECSRGVSGVICIAEK